MSAELGPGGSGARRVTSCAGCGACCAVQGAPPDYVALAMHAGFASDPSFADDLDRWTRLPAEARADVDRYLRRRAAGEIPDDGPCVWYDPVASCCRHYEWRPSTCRVFELDGPGCHIYRRLAGVEAAP